MFGEAVARPDRVINVNDVVCHCPSRRTRFKAHIFRHDERTVLRKQAEQRGASWSSLEPQQGRGILLSVLERFKALKSRIKDLRKQGFTYHRWKVPEEEVGSAVRIVNGQISGVAFNFRSFQMYRRSLQGIVDLASFDQGR